MLASCLVTSHVQHAALVLQVGVIAFSNTVLPPPGDENEKCYSENLAFATYNVIQYLKSYVNGLQVGALSGIARFIYLC